MPTTTYNPGCVDCPTDEALHRLLADEQGNGSDPDPSGIVTAHVGDCPSCQARLEALAADGHVSAHVRHVDRDAPPQDSAYWRAIAAAEKPDDNATSAYNSSTGSLETPVDERGPVSLDFLSAPEVPSDLGRLGAFEVKTILGRGGFGVVLRASDPWLRRDVAIKVLDPQLANTEVARQRFCREARAAAAVAHDNIVTVYQVDESENFKLPYLVMQLIEGESLEQRLRRVGKMSVVDVVRLGAQSAAGLAAAHASGLIHRDIKPGNILLEAGTDKAKLTDFGLARAADDSKLTRTGFVAGTPLYMAPEQARGEDADARADLFSLGSVLYEALAGKPPFEGRTPLAVLRRVADEAHSGLRKVNKEVPVWLENLVDRLLAKNPADRFQTAQEVAEALSFKLVTLQNPHSPEAKAKSGVRPECEFKSRKAKWWGDICVKTASTVGTIFIAGLLAGGVGTLLFLPKPKTITNLTTPPPVAAIDAGPEPLKTFASQSGAIWAVALSPDGTTLATGSESGQITLWDVASGRKRELMAKDGKAAPHIGTIWEVEFIASGNKLVSASDDGMIKTWDVDSGKELSALPVPAIRAAAVSTLTDYIAIGDRTGIVWVFDLKTNHLIVQYDQQSAVNAVAFSPTDGLTLLSGAADGSVVVHDPRSAIPRPAVRPRRACLRLKRRSSDRWRRCWRWSWTASSSRPRARSTPRRRSPRSAAERRCSARSRSAGMRPRRRPSSAPPAAPTACSRSISPTATRRRCRRSRG